MIMDLLEYLIDSDDEDTEIAPAEERNSFSGITDSDAKAREQAEARKRYY